MESVEGGFGCFGGTPAERLDRRDDAVHVPATPSRFDEVAPLPRVRCDSASARLLVAQQIFEQLLVDCERRDETAALVVPSARRICIRIDSLVTYRVSRRGCRIDQCPLRTRGQIRRDRRMVRTQRREHIRRPSPRGGGMSGPLSCSRFYRAGQCLRSLAAGDSGQQFAEPALSRADDFFGVRGQRTG